MQVCTYAPTRQGWQAARAFFYANVFPTPSTPPVGPNRPSRATLIAGCFRDLADEVQAMPPPVWADVT